MNDAEKKQLLQDVRSYLKAHYVPADAPGFFASPFIVGAALSTHALQKGCSRRVKFAKLRRSKNANSGRLKFANLSQSKRANHKISTAQIGCSGYG